jgi:hypothetical protein
MSLDRALDCKLGNLGDVKEYFKPLLMTCQAADQAFPSVIHSSIQRPPDTQPFTSTQHISSSYCDHLFFVRAVTLRRPSRSKGAAST